MTRVEELLEALANGETSDIVSKSDIEKYLLSLINGETNVPEPNTPIEAYFHHLCVNGGGSTGGGGVGIILSGFTTDYSLPTKADLSSIPAGIKENAGKYVNLFRNDGTGETQGFFTQLTEVSLPNDIVMFAYSMFQYCSKLKTINGDFSKVKAIDGNAFAYCQSLTDLPYMPKLATVNGRAFDNCKGLISINLYNKLSSFAGSAFNSCTNLLDIYVPWSEGEVANAPWGATNATIHYNTVYDENHEPIV